MRWHWLFSVLALVGGACVAGYAGYVWRRRRASAGASLALVLAAAGWWGLAYAVELAATRLDTKLVWGDAKWLGICLLPPAWFTFILRYLGQDRWLNRYTTAALAVPPLVMIVLLANPGTHDLVRYYPAAAAADPANAIAQVGPAFWPFLAYANLLVWGTTALFVWTLTRLSRRYWRQSLVLIVAVLLPSVANVLHNLDLGAFGRVEPTPFLFVLTGAVLVWGVFRPAPPDELVLGERHQRRRLLSRVVWAQEEERRRIAGEVHDDAVQTIAATRLLLSLFRDQLQDAGQRQLLVDAERSVLASLRRLRTLVFDLRPPELDHDGLRAALNEYLTEAAGHGGFQAELRDELAEEPPAEARVVAYRICQQALTNVRVHARATRVELRLEEARGGLLVTVADDGVGFDPDKVKAAPRPGHVGLSSMEERATMVEGWLRVDSRPGQGTAVRFWLPTKAQD